MSVENYELDFDFDNFEEELSEKINQVKTPEELDEVVDGFLSDLDFDFGFDSEDEEFIQDDVFKD